MTTHIKWQNSDIHAIKNDLINIAQVTIFENPRGKKVTECVDVVKYIVENLDSELLQLIIQIGSKDYTTATHSINVTALGINYTIQQRWSNDRVFKFAICCLLHDIGKTEIPDSILKSTKKLTSDEFKIMRNHTTIGATILSDHNFGDPEINSLVIECAQFHHEKINGTGYHLVDGKTLSEYVKVLSVIDCYEALTTDDRPYRDKIKRKKALKIIGEDSLIGHFDRPIWAEFVASLYL